MLIVLYTIQRLKLPQQGMFNYKMLIGQKKQTLKYIIPKVEAVLAIPVKKYKYSKLLRNCLDIT